MLRLFVSFCLLISLVNGTNRSLIFEALTMSISHGATQAAQKSINCENLMVDLASDGFYSSCVKEYTAVQVQNATIILQYNWMTNLADKETRCYCALSMLQLLIPIDIYQSGLCSVNGTLACEKFCVESSNSYDFKNGTVCDSVHNCKDREEKCLIYFSHGTHVTDLQRGLQAIVVVISSGITCSVIRQHRRDICDVLYENNTSFGNTDDTDNTPIVIGSSVATVVGMAVCITGLVLILCSIHKNRKKKLSESFSGTKKQPGSVMNGFLTNYVNLKNALYSYTKSASTKKYYKDLFETVLVKHSDLKITCEIGQGAFGIVYKGVIVHSGVGVAIKTLKDSSTSEDAKDFIAESAIMLEFNHPNVLKLIGMCFDTDHGLPLIILPYMINGDLKNFLVSSRKDMSVEQLPEAWDFSRLRMMCLDIAKGMEYLSEAKFVHRDLAARNCMVDEHFSVKVADFGFARDVYGEEYYRMKRRARLPVKWLSPESLFDNVYNERTDVWSFGVTCWEVYSLGRSPYPGLDNGDVPDYIESGNRLCKPALCGKKTYSVMMQCWSNHSQDRPTFRELVNIIQCMSAEDEIVQKPLYFVLDNACLDTEENI